MTWQTVKILILDRQLNSDDPYKTAHNANGYDSDKTAHNANSHGHQSSSFIAYTSWTKLSISLILRAKFRNRAMLLDETLIELSNTDIGFKGIFCMTV